jgi:hypothetical protein
MKASQMVIINALLLIIFMSLVFNFIRHLIFHVSSMLIEILLSLIIIGKASYIFVNFIA